MKERVHLFVFVVDPDWLFDLDLDPEISKAKKRTDETKSPLGSPSCRCSIVLFCREKKKKNRKRLL